MNTGLQDAANLAWKVAMAVRGQAAAGLLESYHQRRWPIGQKILNYTDKLFAGMSSQTGWVAAVRNTIMPIFAATVTKFDFARSTAFHFLSQLGIHYHDNPYLLDDASPKAPRAWVGGLTAGRRAPNALIARNVDVFSLIHGYRFHVLAISRTPLTTAQIDRLVQDLATLPKNIGIDIKTHVIAHTLIGLDERIQRVENADVFRAYGVSNETPQALFFIRPDGHIAYRADRLDVGGLRKFIERLTSG